MAKLKLNQFLTADLDTDMVTPGNWVAIFRVPRIDWLSFPPLLLDSPQPDCIFVGGKELEITPLSKQQLVCRDLRILDTVRYHTLDHPNLMDKTWDSNRTFRHSDNGEMHILDCIATSLSTGAPGDVVAATFKREGAETTLVIAKNNPPSDSDKRKAQEFLDAAKNQDEKSFLATVMKSSSALKRITKLGQSLDGSKLNDIKKRLNEHAPVSVSHEFPFIKNLHRFILAYGGTVSKSPELVTSLGTVHESDPDGADGAEAKKLLGKCLDQIITGTEHFKPYNNFNNLTSKDIDWLLYLDARCFTFVNSTFWKVAERTDDDRRLTRRLNKTQQRISGLERVRKQCQTTAGKLVKLQWVTELQGYVAPPNHPDVQMPETFEAALVETGMTQDEAKKFKGLKGIEKHWKKEPVRPRFHCELNLARSLSNLYPRTDHIAPAHFIGCSKRSCMSCDKWLENFNWAHHTDFSTSGSHGKPYAAWGLSGIDAVDNFVYDDIERKLRTHLGNPKSLTRQHSDSNFSGDSDDPGQVSERHLEITL
ncbi:hypothetical protein BD410DRAFT_869747 [Rickenella mellea]|uniref:Uncharacterized protein n=1 Tax=Rickenella mellea TaxID=50990 RepID=A0A4Y7QK11_9AGAM|nr:hypothetical protein BD410DRAFT_869747 [Rickenella mellea]